jgi:hypothetical protein
VLYVEEGDTKDKLENFSWHREFNKAFDIINLSFNDINDASEACNQFKVKLQTKRSSNLQDLKVAVGSLFGRDPDKLILRKNSQKGELKGLSLSLKDLGLIDGDLISVEVGTPKEEDSFEVQVHLVTLIGD